MSSSKSPTALSTEQLLTIYRRNLAKYETAGDLERVRIQKKMIARLEAEQKAET